MRRCMNPGGILPVMLGSWSDPSGSRVHNDVGLVGECRALLHHKQIPDQSGNIERLDGPADGTRKAIERWPRRNSRGDHGGRYASTRARVRMPVLVQYI